MAIQTVNSRETKPYVFSVNGQPLFGIMANVTVESEAGSLSVEELNQVLFSGMHAVEVQPYVKKERDFSDKREGLLTPTVKLSAAQIKANKAAG